jgi:hypothetical protein
MSDRRIGARQQRGRNDYLRQATEQPLLLKLEPLRVGIDPSVDRGDFFP